MSGRGWTPIGYITADSELTSDLDAQAEREPIAATPSVIEFTVPAGSLPPWLFDARDTEPRYVLTTAMTQPVALRTGPLLGRRVDHARRLRLDKWKRRRQRRHGIPAAVGHTWITYPRVRMVAA